MKLIDVTKAFADAHNLANGAISGLLLKGVLVQAVSLGVDALRTPLSPQSNHTLQSGYNKNVELCQVHNLKHKALP